MSTTSKSFCDETRIKFLAGKGGDGCASFRREKHVAKGGPNGGDGGNGGNVVLVADENINTLVDFTRGKKYKAQNGEPGRSKDQYGKYGEDLRIKIPVGTIVRNLSGDTIADLKTHKQEVIIAKGGKGGMGNAKFATSTHQTPTFAEKGEPGEQIEVELELKLVGDIGIIGLPSAGKSTLLSIISNAKPKIAAYHFTTIIPNLGIVNLSKYTGEKGTSFIAADIPGLIEEAHKGKGLGHQFLKHISRTSVLIHMIDGSLENPYQNFCIINKELEQYDKQLAKKPQIIVLNKSDILEDKRIKEIEKEFKKHKKNIFCISAIKSEGIKELLLYSWQLLLEERKKQVEKEENEPKQQIILKPHLKDDKSYRIYKLQKNLYKIDSAKLKQMVYMTDLNHYFGRNRIYKYLKSSGIEKAIIKEGAKDGDTIIIGEKQIPFQKYIQ